MIKSPVIIMLILTVAKHSIRIMPAVHKHIPNRNPTAASRRIALLRPALLSSIASAARPPSRGSAGNRFTSVKERLKAANSSAAVELMPNSPMSAFAQHAAVMLAAGPDSAIASACDGLAGSRYSRAINPKGCISMEQTRHPRRCAIMVWANSCSESERSIIMAEAGPNIIANKGNSTNTRIEQFISMDLTEAILI